MPKNPDDLMNLPPSELKSLSRGEFAIYCGMKFEALERCDRKLDGRVSKLDRRLWYLMVATLSTLATVILSAAL